MSLDWLSAEQVSWHGNACIPSPSESSELWKAGRAALKTKNIPHTHEVVPEVYTRHHLSQMQQAHADSMQHQQKEARPLPMTTYNVPTCSPEPNESSQQQLDSHAQGLRAQARSAAPPFQLQSA